MNTGIQDAVDLAWKLAAMLRRLGRRKSARLLQSRTPAGRRQQRRARQRQSAPHAYGQLPCRLLDATAQKARQRGNELAASSAKRRAANGTRAFISAIAMRVSPICWPDGTAAPPDDPRASWATARPGPALRTPSWPTAARRSIRSVRDTRFCASAPTRPRLRLSLRRQTPKVPMAFAAIAEPHIAKLYERKFVLVRPVAMSPGVTIGPLMDALRLVDVVRGAATNIAPNRDPTKAAVQADEISLRFLDSDHYRKGSTLQPVARKYCCSGTLEKLLTASSRKSASRRAGTRRSRRCGRRRTSHRRIGPTNRRAARSEPPAG